MSLLPMKAAHMPVCCYILYAHKPLRHTPDEFRVFLTHACRKSGELAGASKRIDLGASPTRSSSSSSPYSSAEELADDDGLSFLDSTDTNEEDQDREDASRMSSSASSSLARPLSGEIVLPLSRQTSSIVSSSHSDDVLTPALGQSSTPLLQATRPPSAADEKTETLKESSTDEKEENSREDSLSDRERSLSRERGFEQRGSLTLSRDEGEESNHRANIFSSREVPTATLGGLSLHATAPVALIAAMDTHQRTLSQSGQCLQRSRLLVSCRNGRHIAALFRAAASVPCLQMVAERRT